MRDDAIIWIPVILVAFVVFIYRRRFRLRRTTPLPLHKSRPSQGEAMSLLPERPKARQSFIVSLLPSCLTQSIFDPSGPAGSKTDTSYLDGLRGLAAWAVFNTHTVRGIHQHVDQAFAASPLDWHIWQLPAVRAVHTGVFAVAIFFVVSGFALSVGVVRRMPPYSSLVNIGGSSSNGVVARAAEFQTSLASAILRRPLRLYLPAWLAVVPTFIFVQTGMFDAVRFYAGDVFNERGNTSGVIHAEHSLAAEVRKMLTSDLKLLNVFRESNWMVFASPYKIQLWTIPIEFRASIVLYVTHAALFTLARKKRVALVAIGMVFAVLCDNMDLVLFWGGYLLCEWHVFRMVEGRSLGRTRSLGKTVLLVSALVASFYVGAIPVTEPEKSPFYSALFYLTPPTYTDTLRFWGAVGAFGTVAIVGIVPVLEWALSSPPLRYLGRLSFGLYLMHSDVNVLIGWPVLWYFWEVLGRDGIGGGLGFVIGYLLLMMAQIWAADLFWRFVDQPCVNLAKSLAKKLFED